MWSADGLHPSLISEHVLYLKVLNKLYWWEIGPFLKEGEKTSAFVSFQKDDLIDKQQ